MTSFTSKNKNFLLLATFAVLLTFATCQLTAEQQKAKDANCKFESYNQLTGNCDVCLEAFFNKVEGEIKKCFACSEHCMACSNENLCSKCKESDTTTKYSLKIVTAGEKQICEAEAIKAEPTGTTGTTTGSTTTTGGSSSTSSGWFSGWTTVFMILCCLVCCGTVIGGVGYYFVKAG